jgi:glutaredoxin 3
LGQQFCPRRPTLSLWRRLEPLHARRPAHCVRAKRLLDHKGIPYKEVDVGNDDELRDRMVAESGRRTVPQIFIDGSPIGGFEELQALEDRGELDALLETA